MLRNNADARRCSYFVLGLPVSNPVNMIIKTVHAHDVGLCPFYDLYVKERKLFTRKENYQATEICFYSCQFIALN